MVYKAKTGGTVLKATRTTVDVLQFSLLAHLPYSATSPAARHGLLLLRSPELGFLDVRIRWLFSYHNPPPVASRGVEYRDLPLHDLDRPRVHGLFRRFHRLERNIIDWSPAWCDLCLYQIASVRTVTKTASDKRRAILIDLAIGLGLPLLQIPLR
ncbi:hypothetical protein C8F04DRAFT_1291875, partial [Mycena alexandri]